MGGSFTLNGPLGQFVTEVGTGAAPVGQSAVTSTIGGPAAQFVAHTATSEAHPQQTETLTIGEASTQFATVSVEGGPVTQFDSVLAIGTPVDQSFESQSEVIVSAPLVQPDVAPLQGQQALGVPSGANLSASYNVLDGSGRVAYTIRTDGGVTQNIYDAEGNVVVRIEYANRIHVSAPPTLSAMQQLIAGVANPALDRRTDYVYDGNNALV